MNAMTQPRLSPICEIYSSKSVKSVDTNQQKITIMKKLYFFFLLLPLWGFVGLAHASVTVLVLDTDFTNKTVTLRVEYANAVNDRAWVWIYLCSMQGMYQPAEISAASVTSGNVQYVSTNTRGFFVIASPATVTATLSNAPDQFSCCAYGSDTPPNMTKNNGTYTFKGTSPFTLIAADGATTQTVTEKTLPASALTMTPFTLTDKTGYPFCIYTGSDLYIDASHLCQPRASGAQNWEAWIKDARDDKLYRIVYMPDNQWWLAQNVKYSVGSAISGCTEEECGLAYTWAQAYASYAGGSSGSEGNVQGVCPPGWLLPIRATFSTLVSSLGTESIACSHLRPVNNTCSPKTNGYGWAGTYGVHNGARQTAYASYYTNDLGREDGCGIDRPCDFLVYIDNGESSNRGVVRCYRVL
jgi:uncharacterized protein (TIGR02145 family)